MGYDADRLPYVGANARGVTRSLQNISAAARAARRWRSRSRRRLHAAGAHGSIPVDVDFSCGVAGIDW
jgi:hypothetical protein